MFKFQEGDDVKIKDDYGLKVIRPKQIIKTYFDESYMREAIRTTGGMFWATDLEHVTEEMKNAG